MQTISSGRIFANGFATGMLLCFGVFGPIFLLQKVAADKLLSAATGNRASLESCTAKLTDVNSRWTLLMDKPAAAVPAAQLLHGLVAIAPGEAFSGPANLSARWEIPTLVVPFIAGPPNGAVYYYWNPETREMDGPHVPEMVGGEKQ